MSALTFNVAVGLVTTSNPLQSLSRPRLKNRNVMWKIVASVPDCCCLSLIAQDVPVEGDPSVKYIRGFLGCCSRLDARSGSVRPSLVIYCPDKLFLRLRLGSQKCRSLRHKLTKATIWKTKSAKSRSGTMVVICGRGYIVDAYYEKVTLP